MVSSTFRAGPCQQEALAAPSEGGLRLGPGFQCSACRSGGKRPRQGSAEPSQEDRGCGDGPGVGTEGGCVQSSSPTCTWGHAAAASQLLASELWCPGSQWLLYLVRSLMTFPGSQTLRALPLGWASCALWGLDLPSGHVSGTQKELCQVGPEWCFPMLTVSRSGGLSVGRSLSAVSEWCSALLPSGTATTCVPPHAPLLCLSGHCPWQPAVL